MIIEEVSLTFSSIPAPSAFNSIDIKKINKYRADSCKEIKYISSLFL